ncbi:FG-GAP-like repeat-containing protein [Leucobacter salsicius]|uniref:FG-GAP-like repeat-containing protein n=1 Tax=Leucobacter salsicius TaxID=664638 RepID=UPI00034B521B|nr:FG-GAP-like repeat-containing protein [Leucobacter salsicius]
MPNAPVAHAVVQPAALLVSNAEVRGPVAIESPGDSGSGSTGSSGSADSIAGANADGADNAGNTDSAGKTAGAASDSSGNDDSSAGGVGVSANSASDSDASAQSAVNGAADAGADPTPQQPPVTKPDEEPRGPNGGIASDSPGPDTAKPWPGEEAMLRELVQAMSSGGRGSVLGNDYPAKYRNLPWPYVNDNIWDEWNFAYRQCTSFVSWRMNNANGVKFSNQYMGLVRWGDAGQWANSARSVGVRVDSVPEVGSIAWSGPLYEGASGFGHVAWVSRVLDNGYIVIEEYNANWSGSYGTRTLKSNEFQGYIHVKDMTKPFTKSPQPTIAGTHSANSELTANTSGWLPAPTKMTYQWMRNGKAIGGATKKTYSPVLADIGANLSVEVTGIRAGFTSPAKRSASTSTILMPDLDGNGLDDTQELLPWNTDVNGDGIPDVVGFHPSGPQVALRTRTGLGPLKAWGIGYGVNNGWRSILDHPRALIDVNGDGRSDIVGFAAVGINVSLSTGTTFKDPVRWSNEFAAANGYTVRDRPRMVADVTGDGLPDAIGFGAGGVEVGVNTGKSFAKAKQWVKGFGTANGWSPDKTRRFLTDMNGDGKADVVGMSDAGVYVALSNGSKFAQAAHWTANFGVSNGWRSTQHPRTLADVNGDGLPDVVGFAASGVYVMLNSGTGLRPMTRWVTGFGVASGWKVGVHPRVLADVNGDGRADIIGFSSKGADVSLSTGSSFKASTRWSTEFGSANWRSDQQPRHVTDVNGDGRADLVGFANEGVRAALSSGSRFNASKLELERFGYKATGWRVEQHPRGIGVQTLSKRPIPAVKGTARVGEKLTASVGSWQPAPVTHKLQWTRDGKAISGASSTSYTLVASDLGTDIALKVSASKPGFAGVALSSTAHEVAEGRLTSAVPTIQGTAKLGTKLTASAGSWGPGDVALTYQWNRGGKPIRNATKQQYQLVREDVGRRITVTVTGTKLAYESASRTSAPLRLRGTPDLPQSQPFDDVGSRDKFYREIAWMSTTGLSTGVKQSSGKVHYQPRTAVSRSAMAAFLFRLAGPKDYAPPTTSPFVDVPMKHKYYREIAWMSTSGLSNGTSVKGGRAYQPTSAVSRAAMAAFIYRLEGAKAGLPKESPFLDMRLGAPFYREISWMYSQNLSTGTSVSGGRVYKPKDPVSRGAMAAFLYRLETRLPTPTS